MVGAALSKTYAGVTRQGHGIVIVYFAAIAFEWSLLAFVWWGSMRGSNATLRAVVAGRQRTWRTTVIDVGVAAVLLIGWGLLEPLIIRALGTEGWGSTAAILPHGALEFGVWIVLSLTAGFCEEIVFRGYLLEQLRRRTRTVSVAILFQAVMFGISHGYQGVKNMALITALGVLYGLVAYWRGSLAPGILAHVWADIASVIS